MLGGLLVWRSIRGRVAILADPGGPVLALGRAAAGPADQRVAILADPGGPVLAGLLADDTGPVAGVAILADPGGPVLALPGPSSGGGHTGWLRSSPTPEGRCWLAGWRAGRSPCQSWLLRSSPTPEGRCWLDAVGGDDGGDPGVAILADPGGPVLAGRQAFAGAVLQAVAILAGPGGPVLGCAPRAVLTARGVAILADPGGPVLGRRSRCAPGTRPACCDPRRPRRAGAGRPPTCQPRRGRTLLRSSPTPEGRCWRPGGPRRWPSR